jgi:4-amino-4-deoxy-L-arabinose transferase-like glycosyltransferase
MFLRRNRIWMMAISIGLLALGVRFVLINQPFVDTWSWRQSDVAAIAKNYSSNGYRFGYPQIDWAGNEPGYVGTEFPVLPFAAALIYPLSGIHPWVGRIQAVLFFALSLPFFFLLVRRSLGDEAAVWALLFYAFAPLGIMASRCFMPDVPSMSLSIVALYAFWRWLETARLRFYWWAAFALAMALLIKLPTIVIGAPLAVLVFEKFGRATLRRWELWIFGGLVLLPSCAWYWHAYRVSQAFYPHHFFGAGGVAIESLAWYGHVFRVMTWNSLTIVLSLLALGGIILHRRDRKARLFSWWGLAMLLFVVLVGYGNRHPWYQLPFVPIAAAFAGSFCAWAWRGAVNRSLVRLAMGAVLVIFLGMSFVQVRMLYADRARDLQALGLALAKVTPARATVVVADLGDPTAFYYGERKGWHFLEKNGLYNGHPADSAAAIADLEDLRQRGATYLAFYSGTRWWPDYYQEFGSYLARTASLVSDTSGYRIYRLEPKSLGQ